MGNPIDDAKKVGGDLVQGATLGAYNPDTGGGYAGDVYKVATGKESIGQGLENAGGDIVQTYTGGAYNPTTGGGYLGDAVSATGKSASLTSTDPNSLGGATGIGSKIQGAAGSVGNALDQLNPFSQPSTAGVIGAATDAQNIQNNFLGQYNGLQPGVAPKMGAAQQGNAIAQAAQPISAAQAQAAQIATGQANQDRASQLALAQSLQGTINGTAGPSVAQLQQNLGFQQLAAQQAGLAAAAGRGGNQALAMRTAMQNQGGIGAQNAAQNSLLRANEVATAQGQLGSLQGNIANQDIGMATNQAGLTQGANLANAQLAQATAMQNQANQQNVNLTNAGFLQNAYQANAANQQQANANNQSSQINTRTQDINQQQNLGQLTNQANANQITGQTNALNAQVTEKGNEMKLESGAAGAASTIFSDERMKTGIRPAVATDLHAAMYAMKPETFAYKAKPEVEHTGSMAQALEKTRMGKSVVRETPKGKALDVPSLVGLHSAMIGDLHRRMGAIEAKKRAA